MAKGMECHIYNCLKKGGTICFTLSLTGFVKASDYVAELGPQHGQTARSWDLSLTAREAEICNGPALLCKCSHCFWSLLIGLCHDKHCKDDFLGFPGGSVVKNPPAIQKSRVRSLDWKDPLVKGMATHSSILAWRTPWTEEPGWLQFMGLQRVWHDWATEHAHTHCGVTGGFSAGDGVEFKTSVWGGVSLCFGSVTPHWTVRDMWIGAESLWFFFFFFLAARVLVALPPVGS